VFFAVLVYVRGAEFDGERWRFRAFLLVLVMLRLFLFSVAALLTLRRATSRSSMGDSMGEWRSVAHQPAQRYM
jgi:hypothetical protein